MRSIERYRPRSILSIRSKLMERAVADKMDKHSDDAQTLSHWGFKKNHSTEGPIFKFKNLSDGHLILWS